MPACKTWMMQEMGTVTLVMFLFSKWQKRWVCPSDTFPSNHVYSNTVQNNNLILEKKATNILPDIKVSISPFWKDIPKQYFTQKAPWVS